MNKWMGRGGFTCNKFDVLSTIILWIELILLAMLYGVAFRSLVVFAVIIFGSIALMYMPKRAVYIIIALSSLWGIIAFSIGNSISWGWASGLGIVFCLLGVGAHVTGLKKLVSMGISFYHENNALCWNGRGGLQNLN